MSANGTEQVDVTVVGGGPAGAAAALAAVRARPGARVVPLDRVDFPRDKACGDGVAAQASTSCVGSACRARPPAMPRSPGWR